MRIIGNGRMITRDASNAFYENGAVAMDGNTITMVGTTEEVKNTYPDAEFTLSCRHLLMYMNIFTVHLRED